jgi:hypothetical protein
MYYGSKHAKIGQKKSLGNTILYLKKKKKESKFKTSSSIIMKPSCTSLKL